jgi:hypothetical protein
MARTAGNRVIEHAVVDFGLSRMVWPTSSWSTTCNLPLDRLRILGYLIIKGTK